MNGDSNAQVLVVNMDEAVSASGDGGDEKPTSLLIQQTGTIEPLGGSGTCQLVKKLLEQTWGGDWCEVVLVCGENKKYAHRCVLVAQSPYFEGLFNFRQEDIKGEQIETDVSDFFDSIETFEAVHKFMYTGEITLTEDNFRSVLHGASLLLMEHLLAAVEQFLVSNLDLLNSLTLLNLATTYNLKELVTRCTQLLRGRLGDLLPWQVDLTKVTHEELETAWEYAGPPWSSPSALANLVVQWYKAKPAEREKQAKTFLQRLTRPCLAMGSLWKQYKADHEVLRLLSSVGACEVSSIKPVQQCVVLFVPKPRKLEDTLQYQVAAASGKTEQLYFFEACIFLRDANEWCKLPDIVIRNARTPEIYPSMRPVGVFGELLVMILPARNFATKRDSLMWYWLRGGKVFFTPGIKQDGRVDKWSYFGESGNVFAVSSSGKREVVVSHYEAMARGRREWVPLGSVPGAAPDGMNLRQVHGRLLDGTFYVFQVFQKPATHLRDGGSNCIPTLITVHSIARSWVNWKQRAPHTKSHGATKRLSFLGEGDHEPFMAPIIRRDDVIFDTDTGINVYFGTVTGEDKHEAWSYNILGDEWVALDQAASRDPYLALSTASEELPCPETSTRVALHGAACNIFETACRSTVLKWYDIETGKVEDLPPPPILHVGSVGHLSYLVCGGRAVTASLLDLQPARSVLRPQELKRMIRASRHFPNFTSSGLRFREPQLSQYYSPDYGISDGGSDYVDDDYLNYLDGLDHGLYYGYDSDDTLGELFDRLGLF